MIAPVPRKNHDKVAHQWLSEGFAEFTAGLVLEKTGGPARARDFRGKEKRLILGAPSPERARRIA